MSWLDLLLVSIGDGGSTGISSGFSFVDKISNREISEAAKPYQEIFEREFNSISYSTPEDGSIDLRLVDLLGTGGQGLSFEFVDETGKEYVGKLTEVNELEAIKAGQDVLFTKLQREIRVSNELNHEGVVDFIDVLLSEKYLLAVRPKVAGVNLAQRAEAKRFTLDKIVDVGLQVSEILDYVHHPEKSDEERRAVVHRDLKPENIIMQLDGTVKVIDFGVASVVDTLTRTRGTGNAGTLGYMAPELFQTKTTKVLPTADVYSLGAVLRNLLTGEDASLTWMIEPLEYTDHRKPLADVINKCMATVDKRYGSMQEVHDALAELSKKGALVTREDHGMVRRFGSWLYRQTVGRFFRWEVEGKLYRLKDDVELALGPRPRVRSLPAQPMSDGAKGSFAMVGGSVPDDPKPGDRYQDPEDLALVRRYDDLTPLREWFGFEARLERIEAYAQSRWVEVPEDLASEVKVDYVTKRSELEGMSIQSDIRMFSQDLSMDSSVYRSHLEAVVSRVNSFLGKAREHVEIPDVPNNYEDVRMQAFTNAGANLITSFTSIDGDKYLQRAEAVMEMAEAFKISIVYRDRVAPIELNVYRRELYFHGFKRGVEALSNYDGDAKGFSERFKLLRKLKELAGSKEAEHLFEFSTSIILRNSNYDGDGEVDDIRRHFRAMRKHARTLGVYERVQERLHAQEAYTITHRDKE